MKRWNILTKLSLGIMVVMLLVGVWTGPVAASEPPERDYTRLEYGLKLALIRVDSLQDHIDHTGELANLAEELVQDEKAAGYDTSVLEAALEEVWAKIDEAQELRDEAAQILEEKAGFDENGEVVDPEVARDTLKNAHRTMQDSNQALRLAKQELRQGLRDYRQSRRDQ